MSRSADEQRRALWRILGAMRAQGPEHRPPAVVGQDNPLAVWVPSLPYPALGSPPADYHWARLSTPPDLRLTIWALTLRQKMMGSRGLHVV